MTRILIVDDNAQNRYLLESILKGNRYEVILAQNGAEALLAAEDSLPDLIVADILMPVMDGFELCRRWKADERLKNIPFMFYTATCTDPKDEQLARSLGAVLFVIKPQKHEVLGSIIRDLLVQRPVNPAENAVNGGTGHLQQYSEAMFHKLEKKVKELETEIAGRRNAEENRQGAGAEERGACTVHVHRLLRTEKPPYHHPGFCRADCGGIHPPRGLRRAANICPPDLVRGQHHRCPTLRSPEVVAGRKSIGTPEQVAFGTVAREAVDLFGMSLLADRGITIGIDPDLPVLSGDSLRLREILVNLLENAIKYRGDRPDLHIRIGIDRWGMEPVIFVQDNGIGIESRYLQRIFNLFEKLDPESPGIGVGLAIARRIIEAHGGRSGRSLKGRARGLPSASPFRRRTFPYR
ncbi:MAG: hybrid sensory histidine kinase BarA [Methanoregula sp. PtaB.Bin085]|nr:response regulator [Methanoregula sp. PtaB.Bin085]OPX64444.1 MAG: hybrid sensory histidine kinase BarA [Methanoregula sp. PtaB.Bin085]